MNTISGLQLIALAATAVALVRMIRACPDGLMGDLRTPLVMVTALAFVKYAVNAAEWYSPGLPFELDHLEDDLDCLWPAFWFVFFFSARLSLSKRDLNAAHQQVEQTLAELQETQERAAREERLKALGRMTSGIAHDFNNNLQPILGYCELLQEAPETWDDPAERDLALATIYRSATHAAKTVRRLQSCYGKQGTGPRLEPVDLSELVRHAVEGTQHAWKHQALAEGREIQVRLDLGFRGTIRAHPANFSDALTNLILNAVDALPQGGEIGVRSRREGNRMVLEIEDDGIGMTPEVLKNCFDPFFTTKGATAKGGGLGLSLAYGSLEAMGAELSIRSEAHRGTTATISAAAEADISPAPPSTAAETPDRRVLLIDDADDVRKVVAIMLSAAHHTVTACSTGAEGWREFEKQRFDVVITAHVMSNESGLELATRMKTRRPDTPVILLTAYGLVMEAAGPKPEQVDAVLSKPIVRNRLLEAMARVVRR